MHCQGGWIQGSGIGQIAGRGRGAGCCFLETGQAVNPTLGRLKPGGSWVPGSWDTCKVLSQRSFLKKREISDEKGLVIGKLSWSPVARARHGRGVPPCSLLGARPCRDLFGTHADTWPQICDAMLPDVDCSWHSCRRGKPLSLIPVTAQCLPRPPAYKHAVVIRALFPT